MASAFKVKRVVSVDGFCSAGWAITPIADNNMLKVSIVFFMAAVSLWGMFCASR